MYIYNIYEFKFLCKKKKITIKKANCFLIDKNFHF